MAGRTKERILEAALKSFSEKGYEGTNLQKIADTVGIVKSAIYRHFNSKEELWNGILDKMCSYYENGFGSADKLPAIPESVDEFKKLVLQMLNFTINDEKIIMTRKLLAKEQFRDERARALATEHFNVGLERMFAGIFNVMMENGTIKKDDPQMLAFTFTAPISSQVLLCDREPEKKQKAFDKINSYIEYFTERFLE